MLKVYYNTYSFQKVITQITRPRHQETAPTDVGTATTKEKNERLYKFKAISAIHSVFHNSNTRWTKNLIIVLPSHNLMTKC